MGSKSIKSLILLCFSVAVVVTVVFVDGRMNPTYQWEKIQIDKNTLAGYEEVATETDAALLSDIYFNDEKLIYDHSTNTFYYSVVDNDDKLTVSLPSSSFKTVLQNMTPKVFVCTDSNDDYKLIIAQKKRISVSNLVFTTLPVMNIDVSAESVENLGLDDTYAINDYETVSMTLFDNASDFSGTSRTKELPAKIHTRGGTTINAPQKSYRLSLIGDSKKHSSKTKDNLLNLREDDDWILFAAYSDYEKVRTVFSMNLWQKTASENNQWQAPVSNEYKYIELFINNRYHGLYALTYPIDKKQFKIQTDEHLFKKKDWSGTEFSLDLEPTDSGDLWLPGYALQAGDMSGFQPLHNLYYQMAYSEDPAVIRSSCDIDNAIDLWLFYKLTQAVDNVYTQQVKNLYSATKLSDSGIDGYKVLFSPWDMDQTFGNRFVDGQGSHGITSYYNSPDYDLPIEWSPVYFLMNCNDETIISEVKARYQYLRQTSWSDEEISKMIAGYEKDIYDSGAFERTMNRWPEGNYYAPSKKLDDFETYVLNRLKSMDNYINDLK